MTDIIFLKRLYYVSTGHTCWNPCHSHLFIFFHIARMLTLNLDQSTQILLPTTFHPRNTRKPSRTRPGWCTTRANRREELVVWRGSIRRRQATVCATGCLQVVSSDTYCMIDSYVRNRHWPIDLVDIHSFISRPQPLPSSIELSSTPRVISLLLHLSNPPQDRLLMPNSIEVCKSQWLNQVKEADFVRWRNTNRVTNLRRVDLEAGWDGIVNSAYIYPFLWPLTYLLRFSLQTTLTCTLKWWTKSCPFPCWLLPTQRNHRDHHLPTLRVPHELPIRPTPQEQSHSRSICLIMPLLSKRSSRQFLNLVRRSCFLSLFLFTLMHTLR